MDMQEPVIASLGDAGSKATQRLIDRFHPAGAQGAVGWTNHQVVRLRTLLGTLQPGSAALSPILSSGMWAESARTASAYSAPEQQLAQASPADLGKLGALGQQGDRTVSLEGGALKPLAQVRITPKI